MVSSNTELESEDLRRAAEVEGADTIDVCHPRQRVILRGVIRTVTLPADLEYSRLEAEFEDGSGVLTLVWMGRREMRGIQAGTVLRVSGRLSSHRGRLALYNPQYQVLRVPGVD